MQRLIRYLTIAILPLIMMAAKKDSLLTFEDTSFDFGTISESADPVKHDYYFINTSDEPVAVLSVSTGCGCTRPKYPVEPIAPGKKSKITITFLPAGQDGDINKDITVRYRGATARSSKKITLRMHGFVQPNAKK